jgi:branched-chain amino acid transport system permease protein
MRFRPLNLGRIVVWSAYAIALAAIPLLFTKSFALTLASQIGIAIIFALSYNMLFGQTGLLSFGHAVYSGLGAYIAVHALNMVAKQNLGVPVTLLPLAGGLAGAFFAVLFGYVTTRRAGTTFAMITLGIGEMVFACSLMFPGFFGGEGGITANRTAGAPFLGVSGWNLGSAVQVYYLIAVWCFIATAGMFAFTRTPLGRIANAVRDNPERAEFVGYDPTHVRYLVMIASGFFAGIAGGLACINYEIVNAENVGALKSGEVLIATFIGGAGFFFGPILGAIVFTFMAVGVATATKAWLLYLGLLFVLMVLYVPGGFASLLLLNIRRMKYGEFKRLIPYYLALAGTGLVFIAGLIGLVEMIYHFSFEAGASPEMNLAGVAINLKSPMAWSMAVGLLLLGAGLYARAWANVRREWDDGERNIELKLNP